MKKLLLLLVFISTFMLLSCQEKNSSTYEQQDNATTNDVSQATSFIPTQENLPEYQNLEIPNSYMHIITMPKTSPSYTKSIQSNFFEWGDYIPVIKYTGSNESEYSILDNNTKFIEDGNKTYNKFINNFTIPDKDSTDYKEWMRFFAKENNFNPNITYMNKLGGSGKQTNNDFIILSSFSNDFQKIVNLYTYDKKHVANLKLPYKTIGVNNITTTCEIEQIVNENTLLLVFTVEERSLFYGYLTKSDTYAFLYNIDTESYTYLSGGVYKPRVSPDLKYLIYVPRTDSFIVEKSELEISINNYLIVINLDTTDLTYINFAQEENCDLQIIGWAEKNDFYTLLNEDPPALNNRIITLSTNEENAENILVELPVLNLKNDFILEEGADIESFNLGGWLPFFKKEHTFEDTGVVTKDFALISNETKDLESAEALYSQFNKMFLNEPITVDENGNVLTKYPFLESKIVEISPDCQKAIIGKGTISYESIFAYPQTNGYTFYYPFDLYSYYINKKLVKPYTRGEYGDVLSISELSSQTSTESFGDKAYKIYDSVYYAPSKTFFNNGDTLIFQPGNVFIYSGKTTQLIKKISFTTNLPDNYHDSIEVGQEAIEGFSVGNIINGKYVPITVERYIRHPEGDCTCGTRGHINNALFLYNIENDELKLMINNFVSYSFSPDMKYLAYTYNNVTDERVEVGDNIEYYEIFEGGLFIKNIETEEFVSYPYRIVNTASDDTPTAAWEAVGWIQEESFNTFINSSKEAVPSQQIVHLIPEPDERTIEFTLNEPTAEDLTLDTNAPTPTESFSFGDYIPFVRYSDVEYDNYRSFSDFAVLTDQTSSVKDGNAVYQKFNNKYRESFEPCEKVKNNISKYLFESRVIYVSENVDTVATFALQDKGKAFKSDSYLDRIWGSKYKVFKNGNLSFSENRDTVDYTKLSFGEYYIPESTREFSYIFNDDKEIKTTENGYLLDDFYRDENVRIYRISENQEDTYLLIYSLKEDRITHKINISEDLARSRVRFIDQVINEKYLLLSFETHNPRSSTEYSKTFLYDMETGEYQFIASNLINPLLSPDMKYIIGNYTAKTNSLYVIDLENNNVKKITHDSDYSSWSAFHLKTINWIRKDKFMEAIAN